MDDALYRYRLSVAQHATKQGTALCCVKCFCEGERSKSGELARCSNTECSNFDTWVDFQIWNYLIMYLPEPKSMDITPVNKPKPFPVQVLDEIGANYGNEGRFEIYDTAGQCLGMGANYDYEDSSGGALKGFTEALVERGVLSATPYVEEEKPLTRPFSVANLGTNGS